MKVIDPGYIYEVENFEHQGSQNIRFIKKELKNDEFVTVQEGTTNEEILKVLIDRIATLNKKNACVENENALHYLISAQNQLTLRTLDRRTRGVEGTPDK